jgi:hypothetical protein
VKLLNVSHPSIPTRPICLKPEPMVPQAGDVATLRIDGLGERRHKVVKLKA